MEDQVNLADVQGLIIKGYGQMNYANYLLLHFKASSHVSQWLSDIYAHITNAASSTKTLDVSCNLAFSQNGIKYFNFDEETMKTFPREFEEGMTATHRQRALGDYGNNAPQNWKWGGPNNEPVHALLLIYAKSESALDTSYEFHTKKLADAKIDILETLSTNKLPEGKEHFGFKDGIANPVLKNAQRNEEKEHSANLINPGEFIFGYKNEYNDFPLSPAINSELDTEDTLEYSPLFEGRKDLGKNGSMLVFRQLEQDVPGFWHYIKNAAASSYGNDPLALASKMVGRWPDGSPLTKCPMAPNEGLSTFDNFGYAKEDFDGMRCPIGAHIRRSNPRDTFLRNSTNPEKDVEKSQLFMRRFRVLRRGRTYGPPFSSTLDIEEMMHTSPDVLSRGLHFLCFNTSIGRQFELIQQSWVNNPKFAGLYEDPDPIMGNPAIMGEGATSTFTVPAEPVRKKVSGIPQFVKVKGGAYFFMPGMNALKLLAQLPI